MGHFGLLAAPCGFLCGLIGDANWTYEVYWPSKFGHPATLNAPKANLHTHTPSPPTPRIAGPNSTDRHRDSHRDRIKIPIKTRPAGPHGCKPGCPVKRLPFVPCHELYPGLQCKITETRIHYLHTFGPRPQNKRLLYVHVALGFGNTLHRLPWTKEEVPGAPEYPIYWSTSPAFRGKGQCFGYFGGPGR